MAMIGGMRWGYKFANFGVEIVEECLACKYDRILFHAKKIEICIIRPLTS